MIKILKSGQTVFYGFCDRCGCEFTYELSDLKLSAVGNKVSCPTCGKDYYHPTMLQNLTVPGSIDYRWPSDSTDPCAGCVYRDNLKQNGDYTGDTPCTWCNKNRFNSITSSQISLKDYTPPCINPPDAYLAAATSSELNGTGNVTAHNNVADGDSLDGKT